MSQKKSSSTPVCIPLQPRLLNVREAASYLSVAVWCVRQLTWTKQLTPIKVGGSRRLLYDRADLDQFVDQQKQRAA